MYACVLGACGPPPPTAPLPPVRVEALDEASLEPAAPLCPAPRHEGPALTFSLVSFRPVELEAHCAWELRRAKEHGFTGVALVPAVAVADDKRYLPRRGTGPREITRCLDRAFAAGFEITYLPHLEWEETLESEGEPRWRAQLQVDPDLAYQRAVLEPFLAWLEARAPALREDGRRLHLIVAAELESALVEDPEGWRALFVRLRARIEALGLGSQVRLGLNPNWWPHEDPSPERCAAYRALIREADFVAPSFYGRWHRVEEGPEQVSRRRVEVLRSLSRGPNEPRAGSDRCEIPEVFARPFAVAEFGTGADLFRSHREEPFDEERFAGALLARRRLFANLLAWARGPEAAAAPGLPLVIWTLRLYDPFGIATFTEGRRIDPAISEMTRRYTQERCGPPTAPRGSTGTSF